MPGTCTSYMLLPPPPPPPPNLPPPTAQYGYTWLDFPVRRAFRTPGDDESTGFYSPQADNSVNHSKLEYPTLSHTRLVGALSQ